eukprot:2914536-Amphidinium_carterae.1
MMMMMMMMMKMMMKKESTTQTTRITTPRKRCYQTGMKISSQTKTRFGPQVMRNKDALRKG